MGLSAGETYRLYKENIACYDRAAKGVVAQIQADLRADSIPFHLAYGRPKDALELYKKQLRKRYENPWQDCPDLVGARIILPESALKSVVVDTLQESSQLQVLEVEDQREGADPESLQYQGLHVHVVDPGFVGVDGKPIRCEVQVRTTAEHAWSETAHTYIYKKPIDFPRDVARTFARLLVLVELFDQELSKGVAQVKELRSYQELELARHLEQSLQAYVPRPTDLTLSLEVIEQLGQHGFGSPGDLRILVDGYLADHADQIAKLVRDHGPESEAFDVRTDWILSQGESLLFLALLDEDEYRLATTLKESDLYEPVEALALRTDHAGFVRT